MPRLTIVRYFLHEPRADARLDGVEVPMERGRHWRLTIRGHLHRALARLIPRLERLTDEDRQAAS